MLAFILLASRLGRPVSAAEVANCTHYDLPELHFEPDQYIGWHSQDRRLYFFGWQAFAEIGQMGSHWFVDADGLTAFSGLPFPADGGWKPGVSWAKQLAERIATTGANEVADTLAGAFTLTRLPYAGDGIVTTDLMSSGALYSDSSQELLVVSNRANLVPIAFGGTARGAVRDWRGPGWSFFSRQPFSTETGYKDVAALEQSHFVDLPFKRRPTIKPRLRPAWEYPEGIEPPKSVDETVERVDTYLRGVMRSVAALPFQRREIRLSGGKDSRVLLALAHAEGLEDKFSLLTYGLPATRDVRTATELAHAIGMPIEFDERVPMSAADFERQARVHAFQVSGTGSPWDMKGGLTAFDELRISGAMSSALRIVSITRKLMESNSDPHAVLREQGHFNPHGLLLPEIERYYLDELDGIVDRALQRLPDASRYGLLHTNLTWNRRWTGPNVEISPQPWLYPYFAPEIWRAAMVLPRDEVLAERFCFDIMRRAAPALSRMPFVGGTWWPEAYRALPDAELYAAMRPVARDGSPSPHWRVSGFDPLVPVFRDYLLDPTNPLYEIVSYERMTELLEAPAKSYSVVQVLYDLLGAAIWMAQDELGERIHRADEVGVRGPVDAVESAPRVRLEPDDWHDRSEETPALRYPETDHLLHSHLLLEHPQGPLLQPDASVLGVIPYFQAESYLADAIDSLVRQSRPLQGIVVIDDCSNVPPTDLLARFPGVTLLRAEENSGPYRLIQEVIDNTTYDAYLFQDADDWSTPNRLEVLLDLAVRAGKELVGSQGHRLIVDEGEVVLYQHSLDPATSLITTPKSKPVHHPTSLVSRDLIQRVGGFSTGLPFSGDTEFLRRAATVGQIANTAEFTYVYRTRSDSLTGSEETGVHTPVRRELWAIQHPRAQWIADRVNAGLDPVLLPMAVTSPVRLQHLSGPPLCGLDGRSWPEPIGDESPTTTFAEHLEQPVY